MKARYLSIFLVLCMLIAVFPMPVSADGDGAPRIVIRNMLRCQDSVTLTLTGDDLDGAYCYGEMNGTWTLDKQIEGNSQKITLENGEGFEKTVIYRYGNSDDLAGDGNKYVDVTPSVPEGFTVTYEIGPGDHDMDTMTITVWDDLTEIDDFDPTGKIKSGEGWSWSSDRKTLTIDSGYALDESEPIRCEKLILNGVIKYALLPDLKEVEGRGYNFESGISPLVEGQRYWESGSSRAAVYVNIVSDRPFSLGYNGAVFSSDEDNSLNFASSVKELTILSGLKGNYQSPYGVTVKDGILTITNKLNATLDDATLDVSWRENNNTITNAAQLIALAYLVNNEGEDFAGETITLGADIDLSDVEFTPIGNDWNSSFKGTFEGTGHTVTLGTLKGLTDRSSMFGLFGALGGGAAVNYLTVKGDILINPVNSGVYFGGIAGGVDKGAKIINCASEAELSVRAERIINGLYVGGLVGWLGGELLNSSFTGGFGSILNADSTSIAALAAYVEDVSAYSDPAVKNCFTTGRYKPFRQGFPPVCDNVFYSENSFSDDSNITLRITAEQITAASGETSEEWYGGKALIDLLNDYTENIEGARQWLRGTDGVPTLMPKECKHRFKWVIDLEPTYTETGLKHRECTLCHERRSEGTVIDRLGDEEEYQPMNAYVVFNTNGGDRLDTLTASFGEKIDLTKYIPTRDGYEFDGWYRDEELTEAVTYIYAAGTATVYAKWVRAEFPFTDVDKDSEYYENIKFVYEKGLMIGTSDSEFSPDMTLTRGMVTTILWRMSGSPVVNFLMDFTDVDEEAYYGEAVRWAQAEKIVNGVGGNLFAPEDEITREQLAAIIYRYVQRNGGGFKGMWYFPLNCQDASDISEYADEAMHWCVMNGIIESDGDNNLRPAAPATRAETAHAYHVFSVVNG